jgi:hypothetical protein
MLRSTPRRRGKASPGPALGAAKRSRRGTFVWTVHLATWLFNLADSKASYLSTMRRPYSVNYGMSESGQVGLRPSPTAPCPQLAEADIEETCRARLIASYFAFGESRRRETASEP